MDEIQIFGNTNYFVITGIVLSGIWAGAYILSWIIQWAWAWVDETKVGSTNFLVNLVYNPPMSDSVKEDYTGWVRTGYTAEQGWVYNYLDKGVVKVKQDVLLRGYPSILPLTWFGVFCANYWYISMWFALAISIAFIARMDRRGQKLLIRHMADKDAHK